MNKTELINAIAAEAELSKKDAGKAVEAFVEVITQALSREEKVQLIGFGTFEVRERAAREGHNPQTKERMMIPASKIPAFKAGKSLKEAITK